MLCLNVLSRNVIVLIDLAMYILLQEVLDADDNPLRDRHGNKMARDIVQFVPLRNFNTQGADFSLVSGNIRNIRYKISY